MNRRAFLQVVAGAFAASAIAKPLALKLPDLPAGQWIDVAIDISHLRSELFVNGSLVLTGNYPPQNGSCDYKAGFKLWLDRPRNYAELAQSATRMFCVTGDSVGFLPDPEWFDKNDPLKYPMYGQVYAQGPVVPYIQQPYVFIDPKLSADRLPA